MIHVTAVRTSLAPDVQAFDDLMTKATNVGQSVATAASPSTFVETAATSTTGGSGLKRQ